MCAPTSPRYIGFNFLIGDHHLVTMVTRSSAWAAAGVGSTNGARAATVTIGLFSKDFMALFRILYIAVQLGLIVIPYKFPGWQERNFLEFIKFAKGFFSQQNFVSAILLVIT